MADALQALDMVVVLEEIMGAYARNSKVMKRSSRRSTVMDEANMMEKAMNLVAKKNSLEPGNCLSFPSISDSKYCC